MVDLTRPPTSQDPLRKQDWNFRLLVQTSPYMTRCGARGNVRNFRSQAMKQQEKRDKRNHQQPKTAQPQQHRGSGEP